MNTGCTFEIKELDSDADIRLCILETTNEMRQCWGSALKPFSGHGGGEDMEAAVSQAK